MTGLVYVMGPSGAGKDTLLTYARQRVDPRHIIFAHRYITRSSEAGGENHVPLSHAEFAARRGAGLFSLCWESHGFCYGVGCEIDVWRQRGLLVIVSGARSHWDTTRARYADARAVLISAPRHILADRLLARGRESAIEINERLNREDFGTEAADVHRIENVGPVALAGERFVARLESWASAPATETLT